MSIRRTRERQVPSTTLELLQELGGPGYNPFSATYQPLLAIRNALATMIAKKQEEREMAMEKAKEAYERAMEERKQASLEAFREWPREQWFLEQAQKQTEMGGFKFPESGKFYKWLSPSIGMPAEQIAALPPQQQKYFYDKFFPEYIRWQIEEKRESEKRAAPEKDLTNKAKRYSSSLTLFWKNFPDAVANATPEQLATIEQNRKWVHHVINRYGGDVAKMPEQVVAALENIAHDPYLSFAEVVAGVENPSQEEIENRIRQRAEEWGKIYGPGAEKEFLETYGLQPRPRL